MGHYIDYMHLVFLGVVRLLLKLRFTPAYAAESFSLYKLVEIVDDRLGKIKPSHLLTRVPRSISESLKFWKAAELRSWFFYYSIPCIMDLLRPDYLYHYAAFVQGIFLLSQDTISDADICHAERLLHYFVFMMPSIYGERYVTINVHSLFHLPQTVKELGPLCRDCNEPVLKGEKGLICDLCSHWLHAKCQEVSDTAYEFLSANENTAISWYCSHCKPAAMGVVSEVQKIAQKYMDLDKRVKKLETQVKHKANASDLTDLRKTFLEELDDKATAEDLKNMQSVINESTKKIVTDTQAVMTKKTETDIKNAITELQKTIPSEDRIKQLIHEETSAATPIQPAEPTANANTREMVDISNRRNNVVVYRLPEQKDSAYKSQGEQRNQKDTTEASKIANTVLDNPPPDSIVKCTRLGKAMPEKDRDLLVTFKDTNIKENFMSNLKNLKGTTYQDISVAHDLKKKPKV